MGRKRKHRNDSSSGVISKKYVRALNKKYIEEVKRRSMFPDTFIYSKLIDVVKRNLKEFFLDPKDLVQNSNGEINRKKGGKRTLSQGAYEYGDGIFDLKFDGRIGTRTNYNPKDKKGRTSISNINKPNHFWWLISKTYLNKFLLEDARGSLNTFFDEAEKNNELFKHSMESKEESHEKVEVLFKSKCLDFDTLVKNDPDLEGIKQTDVKDSKNFVSCPMLDDKLWDNDIIIEEESEELEDGMKFY